MKIHGFAALAPREPLQPFSYETPHLEPFEILLKVTHSGLCHTDLHMIQDDWKRSSYPLLPGHEVVGTIVKKGEAVNLKVGQRIGVSWLRSACLQCSLCLQGDTNLCPNRKGCYNKGAYGGFADHMMADSRFVYPIPEALDSAHAAPLLCAGATVYAPLKRYGIQGSHHVAILGIGGLGHLALQFARAFGCEVTAISSSPLKEKEAKKFGAHHFYSLGRLPPPMQFDLLLCTTDANLDWNEMLALLKPKGTLCFVSRPLKGAMIDLASLISPERSLAGSNNANRAQMNEMLAFAARQNITPQIELMPLSQINEALEKLRANKVRYRIVLTPDF